MLDRINTLVLSTMISAMLAVDALAQTARPPNAPMQFSLEKAWAWLVARPGVVLAGAVALAALGYMIYANRRKKA